VSEEPCTRLGAELSGYHDEMLDEATRLKVEAHLQSCAACRARLADYARVDRAVAVLGAPVFEDRLREDLVAYARATIKERGRQSRRERQFARLRSWRTLVPVAAAAGVAILVLKLTDGGFPAQLPHRRDRSNRVAFESARKSTVEGDSLAGIVGSGLEGPRFAQDSGKVSLGPPEAILGRGAGAPRLAIDQALPVPPDVKKMATVPPAEERTEPEAAGKVEGFAEDADLSRARTAAGRGLAESETLPLAKESQEKAAAQPVPPVVAESTPPADAHASELQGAKDKTTGNPAAPRAAGLSSATRGHLDPEAALSIATLALQVGDLTGARLALQDFPTLPADSLTARAAVLALALAERSQDLGDCKAARERADVLVEAAPSSALADTLRVRRAALPCPH